MGTETIYTPDRRYIVVDGRLWRAQNPKLSEATRESLVAQLMDARRGLRRRGLEERDEAALRDAVHRAKVALGERGPVWWDDGAPDQNRRLVTNSSYAEWWASRKAAKREGLLA